MYKKKMNLQLGSVITKVQRHDYIQYNLLFLFFYNFVVCNVYVQVTEVRSVPYAFWVDADCIAKYLMY